MPNIREYDAPDRGLTASQVGESAWETAGRRVGPLYDQAAQDIRRGASLANEPLDQAAKFNDQALADLKEQGAGQGSRSRSGGGSGSSKLPAGVSADVGAAGHSQFLRATDEEIRATQAAERYAYKHGGYGGSSGDVASYAAKATSQLNRQSMTLNDYQDQKDRLYDQIANGGTASADELRWFEGEKAQRQKQVAAQMEPLNKYLQARDKSIADWQETLDKQAAADAKLERAGQQVTPQDWMDYTAAHPDWNGAAPSSGGGGFVSRTLSQMYNGAQLLGSDLANGAQLLNKDLFGQGAAAAEGRE